MRSIGVSRRGLRGIRPPERTLEYYACGSMRTKRDKMGGSVHSAAINRRSRWGSFRGWPVLQFEIHKPSILSRPVGNLLHAKTGYPDREAYRPSSLHSSLHLLQPAIQSTYQHAPEGQGRHG